MTSCFEQSSDALLASGGLDNTCSVWTVTGGAAAGSGAPSDRPIAELQGHDGYLSSCHFVDRGSLLTASGDSTCIFWDLSQQKEVQRFSDHGGDVLSLSVHPSNRSLFVSGSCDTTAKVRSSVVGERTGRRGERKTRASARGGTPH
jgi:guanine nucleotide-binding protein G(I)/G(S)/G(T) subunit beta-1